MEKHPFEFSILFIICSTFLLIGSSDAFGKTSSGKPIHQFGSNMADASISNAIRVALLSDPFITPHLIQVDTKLRVVYLKGEVPNQKSITSAIKKARSVPGVRGVINMLKVRSR